MPLRSSKARELIFPSSKWMVTPLMHFASGVLLCHSQAAASLTHKQIVVYHSDAPSKNACHCEEVRRTDVAISRCNGTIFAVVKSVQLP